MQTTLTKAQKAEAKAALKLRDATDKAQAESRRLEAERMTTLEASLATRIETLEGVKPEQEQIVPAAGETITVTPPEKVTITLIKGRPCDAAYLAKEIGDARSRVGNMVNREDFAGDRLTGSDKKGNVAEWQGHYLRPCNSKTEVRAQAVLKAAQALARALALPSGSTL